MVRQPQSSNNTSKINDRTNVRSAAIHPRAYAREIPRHTLNSNMLAAGADFVREAKTDAHYRCWSIQDDHPAMIRTRKTAAEIDVEIWSVSAEGLAGILAKEPAGLCIGKVWLNDGSEVLGVLGEPWVVEGEKDITTYGGWRNYIAGCKSNQP